MITNPKKVLLIVLLIIAALPVIFYGAWNFYSYKFRKSILEQINSSFTFYYKDCKISGFPSTVITLTFSEPVLYLGDDINKVILKFDTLQFTKKFNENSISVQNDKFIKAKVNGEKFILDRIKNAEIFLNPKKEAYMKMTLNQPGFDLYNDEGEMDVFEDVDFSVETEIERGKDKRVSFSLVIMKDGRKAIEQDVELRWDKTQSHPEYTVNVNKMKLDNAEEYKLSLEGKAKISFSYKYNIDGSMVLFIENYDNFFQSLSEKAKNEKEGIQEARKFLLENSEIDGKNLKTKLHGDGNRTLIGERSVEDLLSATVQN